MGHAADGVEMGKAVRVYVYRIWPTEKKQEILERVTEQ